MTEKELGERVGKIKGILCTARARTYGVGGKGTTMAKLIDNLLMSIDKQLADSRVSLSAEIVELEKIEKELQEDGG